MASWYLKHIIVHDLQTEERFYFICEQWMGVEKEDGRIERELFVAGDKQIKELKYFLEKQSKQQMNDSHLWLSIFNRPVQSKFTRLDRVTCGFVFIYTSMLLNILYYEKSWTFFESNKIDFFVFSITFEQVKINDHYSLVFKFNFLFL